MEQDKLPDRKRTNDNLSNNAENVDQKSISLQPPSPVPVLKKSVNDHDKEKIDSSSKGFSKDFAAGASNLPNENNSPPTGPFQLKDEVSGNKNDVSGSSKNAEFGGYIQAKMENAFGQSFHDVNVHTDSKKASDIGARAYTQGKDIHFAPGQYNPKSTAGQELIGHELTHVVQQQKSNVKPSIQAKGVLINDDQKLESEADAMGKKAASASETTSHYSSGSLQLRSNMRTVQTKSDPIQMAVVESNWGKFEDKDYKVNQAINQAEIKVEFDPGDRINAPKIGMSQAIKSYISGNTVTIDPSQKNRLAAGKESEGYQTDRISPRTNPIYGSPDLGAGKELKDTQTTNKTKTSTGTYQLGWRYWKNRKLNKQIAWLWDRPTMGDGNKKNSGQIFETTALVLEGPMKGTYLGSVQWGWQRDASNTFSKVPFKLLSKGIPTSRFMDSAKAWNDGTQRGTVKTNAKAKFLINALSDKTTIEKDIKVSILSPVSWGGTSYYKVNPLEGTHKGKTGYIPNANLTDQGDGAATTDLPLTQSKTINAQGVWLVRQPRRYRETIIKKLPKKTKVQVLEEGKSWNKVIVDGGLYTGRLGWVMKNYLE